MMQEPLNHADVISLYDATELTADGLAVEDCVAVYKHQ